MARQATNPVPFNVTQRVDEGSLLSSGRLGKVTPLLFVPVLRGDSASGKIAFEADLAEMPRPLRNGMVANVQAWFVPKGAHPQFTGSIDLMHAYTGEQLKTLTVSGEQAVSPPSYFFALSAGAQTAVLEASELLRTVGLHPVTGVDCNTDYVDAFNLVYNFRLAAHSSRLTRRPYAVEDLAASVALPRAFWPVGNFPQVVPDYERALIVGTLALDVAAGAIPVSGLGVTNTFTPQGSLAGMHEADFDGTNVKTYTNRQRTADGPDLQVEYVMQNGEWVPKVFAQMAGQQIGVTLAAIDKARETQGFAKLRTSYAGNDATGFDNDDAIVATLMQGLQVPAQDFKRPFLLDSQVLPFALMERFASDGANLDKSVSQGRVAGQLSVNLPRAEEGGTIVVTLEVVPERLDERMSDEFLHVTSVDDLPNALRDVQRDEPVDNVLNRRIDARHTSPSGVYGFEPMNSKWNRRQTRLGGAFYQANPAAPWTEQRSAIVQTGIIDPTFTEDHWLVPASFPHDVFSDTAGPAFEMAVRHHLTIVGLTQFGDILAENNDDYAAITAE